MPYQVTFNNPRGRGRGRTSTAYRLKPAALKYAAAQRKKGFKARVEIDQYCVIWSRK